MVFGFVEKFDMSRILPSSRPMDMKLVFWAPGGTPYPSKLPSGTPLTEPPPFENLPRGFYLFGLYNM